VTSLVPSGPPPSGSEDLRARVAELERVLGERLAGIGRVKVDLAAFKVRYHEAVGRLHEELDELEEALAEAELGAISARLEEAGAAGAAAAEDSSPEAAPRFTSDAVRRLFRDVARTIHPDLATDQGARDRRHALMVEANRAYASGDEERLRRILQAWHNSPEAVPGDDPDAARLRLERRIAEINAQIDACALDLAALQESPLWKLKAMVDEAAAGGKDLVADMVRRLKRDILVTRNRLDAMRS
jgi:hypothetical protein